MLLSFKVNTIIKNYARYNIRTQFPKSQSSKFALIISILILLILNFMSCSDFILDPRKPQCYVTGKMGCSIMNDIRVMDISDVDEVVKIHIASFPGFFLTFLGEKFLQEFYRSALLDKNTIALVIYAHGIQAFAVGTTQAAGLYKRLLQKYWWRFGLASMGAFLKRPLILPRLLRAFTMSRQEIQVANCATLISIAVAPYYQGQGQGKQLIKAFFQDAAQRGCKHVNLITDALDNDFANAFYCNVGFALYRSFITPEGRLMNEYIKAL